ncbi:ABC transporter substrate-binding protein [Cardinium endosymbiont of Culicoides punctatus]|uniref:ABC transporter substrate-binding protein n=1 Tax=Cardinium endosymbiont of Culicoides punctatus TaxID=2304601 RepID=UPI0010586D50|nr:ABC transporter substrate-binding protein [Cardinium endosymbiont of Culicoides punctatus]TDG95170.1 Periplasmic dipeptide transport protein [Cardinium endosymbiont of Culicoides punctatus]
MNKFVRYLLFLAVLLTLVINFWPKQEGKNTEKVLNLSLDSKVDGMDPATVTSLYATQLTGKVYENLLEYHYLKRPSELIPNLAESMPTVSEDGLTYTFSIKKGVYFHDNVCFPNGKGKELTAEDFVYTFKRIADPAVRSPHFDQLANSIKGYRAFNKHVVIHKGDYSYPVEGIKALDRYTLQFTLITKHPIFLHALARASTSVVAKEAVEYYGDAFVNHPVGTGPFTLDHFNAQSNKIVFSKNKNFREKYYPTDASPALQHMLGPAGKKVPFLDKIIYHVMHEEQPRWLQFKNKVIDCVEVVSTYTQQVFENGTLKQELKQQGVSLVEEACSSMYYIGFNCLKKPLDNQKLRQAMSLAFDREAYNKLFCDGLGIIYPSFIPSSFVGYNPELVNPYITYDLEKARQYLADAGYPNGKGLPTLTVNTSIATKHRIQLEFFAKCMDKLGIKVEIQQSTFPELLKKLLEKDYLISKLGSITDFPDASDFFCGLRFKTVGGGIHMEDPTFDKLYDQAVQMEDFPEKTAAYEKLNGMLVETMPALLLPALPEYMLVHKRVKNYAIDLYSRGAEQYVDVDP